MMTLKMPHSYETSEESTPYHPNVPNVANSCEDQPHDTPTCTLEAPLPPMSPHG